MYKNNALSDNAAIDCAKLLQTAGTVLLVPPETVYGLVARWDDKNATEEIYRLKGREKNKPLALFVRSADDIVKAGGVVDSRAEKLINSFMPGPLTLILPGKNNGPSVGIRMPDHYFIQQLLQLIDFPLASTSANASGQPNALTAAEALAMLDGEPAACIDAGPLPPDAAASTIVDLRSAERCTILRPGPIPEEAIMTALAE